MAEGRSRADRLRAQFEAVLEQMPVGVMLAEAPGGRLVLVNRQMDRIWRQPFRPAEGVEGYGSWEGYHPDGRRYEAEEWPLARSLATGEVVDGEEIAIRRGDGTRGVIRASSAPVRDESGTLVGAVGTCSDVTEQRRQEEARRFLGEASALLAGSLDYETTLRTVARLAVPALADQCHVDIRRDDGRIERLAVEHVDPERAGLAREIARRFPPDPEAGSPSARAMRTAQPVLIPEVAEAHLSESARGPEHLEMLRRMGLRSALVVPLVARQRTLGAIAFLTADSGRCYGPAELELAQELALRAALAIDNARLYHESQTANRAKSDFLAVISHELRTPLTAIIGYAELLALGVPDPVTRKQQEHVERIEVSAKHLLQLIEEILTVVRLEGGQTTLRPQPVRLEDALRRAEIIMQPLARSKQLELTVDPPPPELVLTTDPDRLLQVLLNLLSNAVKFTDRGGVHLAASREGEHARITVRDTGIGLPEEQRERIYDVFWQAEEPVTRRVGGTGVGLTITRRLVELLGGEIQVESVPGEGSTFSVRLPLAGPAAGGEDPGRAPHP